MEIAVWQAVTAMIKQAYPHAPLCIPSMGSADVFGHEGLTISSITLRYFQWFNSLSLSDLQIGLSTHPGTGVDGAGGQGWKLADFLLKHV